MSTHLDREIDRLKRKILSLGAVVEQSLQQAVKSLRDRDTLLAMRVMKGDRVIDEREVEIEEDCQKILALHQPVAADLRFIIAVLKINSELERIGDATVNVCERAVYIQQYPRVDVQFDFETMTERVQRMVRDSLDALVNMDSALAYDVIKSDDGVDELNREMYILVQDGIRRNPDQMEALIHHLGVARHLERIGDHASNIAEDAIYMVAGDIVRHRHEDFARVHAGGQP